GIRRPFLPWELSSERRRYPRLLRAANGCGRPMTSVSDLGGIPVKAANIPARHRAPRRPGRSEICPGLGGFGPGGSSRYVRICPQRRVGLEDQVLRSAGRLPTPGRPLPSESGNSSHRWAGARNSRTLSISFGGPTGGTSSGSARVSGCSGDPESPPENNLELTGVQLMGSQSRREKRVL